MNGHGVGFGAVALSVAAHVLLVAFVGFSVHFRPTVIQPVTAPIQAQMVPDLQKLAQLEEEKRRLAEAERKRLEEEKRRRAEEEKKRKAEEEKKRKAEQEKKRKAEEEKKRKIAADKKRKAEEKKKREAEKKRKAEAEKKRKAEAEKKKKAEAERKRKAEEDRRRREEEERLAIEVEREQTKQGAYSALGSLVAQIQSRVTGNWIRPQGLPAGLEAVISVNVTRSGEVVSAKVVRSSGNSLFDRSAEHAVLKASPLPFPDNPRYYEFIKSFNFKFTPDG